MDLMTEKIKQNRMVYGELRQHIIVGYSTFYNRFKTELDSGQSIYNIKNELEFYLLSRILPHYYRWGNSLFMALESEKIEKAIERIQEGNIKRYALEMRALSLDFWKKCELMLSEFGSAYKELFLNEYEATELHFDYRADSLKDKRSTAKLIQLVSEDPKQLSCEIEELFEVYNLIRNITIQASTNLHHLIPPSEDESTNLSKIQKALNHYSIFPYDIKIEPIAVTGENNDVVQFCVYRRSSHIVSQ